MAYQCPREFIVRPWKEKGLEKESTKGKECCTEEPSMKDEGCEYVSSVENAQGETLPVYWIL